MSTAQVLLNLCPVTELMTQLRGPQSSDNGLGKPGSLKCGLSASAPQAAQFCPDVGKGRTQGQSNSHHPGGRDMFLGKAPRYADTVQERMSLCLQLLFGF